MRTLALLGAAMVSPVAMASAQDTQGPAACAGLAADSAAAAILGCNQSTAIPALSDQVPADEPSDEDFQPPLAAPASEPFADAAVGDPEPIAKPVPEPLGTPLPGRNDELLGDATDEGITPSELPPTPPAEDLVALFADWLERHPLGEPVDRAEAKLLDATDLPAGLPTLPPSRRYAELDGMSVEVDPETEELLRLVRRAETAAADPDALAEVAEEDTDEPRASDNEVGAKESEAAQQAEEERERQEALTREEAEAREQQEREAAERAEEERQREDELAREEVEREREEEAREQEESEADERAEEEPKREEERLPEAAERERNEEERQEDQGGNEAQAFDIPNGHMPPPGSCRVWFPDREPGQQPPPTSCDVEVPDGAVLVQR